jgi:hypothetical protein
VTIADEPDRKTIAKAEVPGLTKAQNPIQIVVLIGVLIITVWTLSMVPSWQAPGDPFLLAAVVGAVTVVCLWLTRWLGSRAVKFERTMLAEIFIGSIASANQVLKNAGKRDQLRDEHGVKAVEMEGSGIADAAWTRSSEYFIVRGICDYCDANKRDDWQAYAAVVAAAYTRVLLSTVPSEGRSALYIWPTIAASLTTVILGAFVLVGPKLSSTTHFGRFYVRTDHLR